MSNPATELRADRLDWLSDHPLVKFAARAGAAFGQDPVAMLRGEEFEILVREAAYQVWVADEKAKADSIKKK